MLLARLLLPALLAAAPARAGEAPEQVQSQVELESAQEARLQTVLRRVLDTDDVLVIVSMDVDVQSHPRLTELLPGVPIKDSPAAADLPTVTESRIRSVNATVMLDDSLPAADDDLAKTTAVQVLGLSQERGDSVSVRRMRLRPQLAARAEPRQWLTPGPLVALLWLLGALGALALVYGSFLKPLLHLLRELGMARAAPPVAAPAALEPAAALAAPEAAAPQPPPAAAAPDEPLPFSYLRERHAPMLKFLLQRAPAKTAAVIVHYLPPKLAVDVLGALPAATRQDVAKAMSRVVQLDEENVRQIEESLRARIDYLMGGEDKLAEIIDRAPPALQDEMLEAVRGEEPAAADRLARRVVRLDDLGLLDVGDLKALSRRVPIRSLAAVLRSSDELMARVMPKLTAGLGAWLAQEVELAIPLTGERLAAERKRVLDTLGQLAREGAVRIPRGEPVAAAVPAPAETPPARLALAAEPPPDAPPPPPQA